MFTLKNTHYLDVHRRVRAVPSKKDLWSEVTPEEAPWLSSKDSSLILFCLLSQLFLISKRLKFGRNKAQNKWIRLFFIQIHCLFPDKCKAMANWDVTGPAATSLPKCSSSIVQRILHCELTWNHLIICRQWRKGVSVCSQARWIILLHISVPACCPL